MLDVANQIFFIVGIAFIFAASPTMAMNCEESYELAQAGEAPLFHQETNGVLKKAGEVLQVGSLVGKSPKEIEAILEAKRDEASELEQDGDHEDRFDARLLKGRIKEAEELLSNI